MESGISQTPGNKAVREIWKYAHVAKHEDSTDLYKHVTDQVNPNV